MNKQEFLKKLEEGLSGLPQDDINDRVTFYCEMIEDKIEEGMSEEAAVDEMDSIQDIISQTISDIPLTKLVKEKMRPKRKLNVWEIVIIVLGFPLWFPLLIAAATVILAVYICFWAVIISLWAVDVSLFAGFACGIASSVYCLIDRNVPFGLAMAAIGMLCAGLTIFAFYGCKAITKGTAILTKKFILKIKSVLVGEEYAR